MEMFENSGRAEIVDDETESGYVEYTVRQSIDKSTPASIMAMMIAENHPGAFLTVTSIIAESDEDTAKSIFMKLDDMNIRGKHLAFAHHSFSAGFISDLINSVNEKEQALIDACNDVTFTSIWHVVPSGASKHRQTRQDFELNGPAAETVSTAKDSNRDTEATKSKFKAYRDGIKNGSQNSNVCDKYDVASTNPADVGAHIRTVSSAAPEDLPVRDLDTE